MTQDHAHIKTLEDAELPQSFTLPDEIVHDLLDHMAQQDIDPIQDICRDLTASEIAQIFSRIGGDKTLELIEALDDITPAEVYAYLDDDFVTQIFERLEEGAVAAILNSLDTDDALDLIENLDEDRQAAILKILSKKMRAALEEGLTFPEDSAGRLMQRKLVAVPEFWTVGKTLDFLRAAKDSVPDNFYDIIVVDPMHHVLGEVPSGRALRAPRSTRISDLTLDQAHPIKADTDQEDVAYLFRREGLASAPVVNADDRLIGVITVDDIVDVIDEEAGEDLLKLGGVSEGSIYRDILKTTRTRFSWLVLNLLTAIFASVIIGLFETTLDQIVALAILMPIVASMGGNAGTQALTVAVRALATKELSESNALRVIGKEVLIGAINGLSFAIITGLVTWLWFHSPELGLIIGAAMIINMIVAGLFGAGIPIVLSYYKLDPAVSSSVFLTTVTDVIGFFAFLGLAALFLI